MLRATIVACAGAWDQNGLLCTLMPRAHTHTLLSSGVTDGGQGGEPPPWQAKCKNRAPLVDILISSIL